MIEKGTNKELDVKYVSEACRSKGSDDHRS